MTGKAVVPGRGVAGHLRHDALLYDSPEHLAAVAAPFVLDGLTAGDAVVVATCPATARLLQEAVGGDPRVQVLEQSQLYRRRTPSTLRTLRRLGETPSAGGSARVRVVGEVDFGPTERHWLEWQRYEAVVNDALSGWPLWGLCLFDTQHLPDPLLEAARQTHPHVATPAGRRENPAYADPADYLRSLPIPAEPLEATPPALLVRDVVDFSRLRRELAAELAHLTRHREAVADFLLAVDEITSNAVRHGRPPVTLRLWTAVDRIVCSISDGGAGWDDPFAGYGPAHGDDLSRGGMGLWLARQLCDHVDIAPGGGDIAEGMGVRLTLSLN